MSLMPCGCIYLYVCVQCVFGAVGGQAVGEAAGGGRQAGRGRRQGKRHHFTLACTDTQGGSFRSLGEVGSVWRLKGGSVHVWVTWKLIDYLPQRKENQ